MKTKALTREDRQRQIMLCFAVDIQSGGTGELTVAEIAKKMHLAPSTKLRIMVNELVEDGSLDYRKEDIPGIAKFRRIYSPNSASLKRVVHERKQQGRAVKINSKQGSFFATIGA